MLVLARKMSEEIVIGRPGDVLTAPIRLTVVRIGHEKVSLGVDAPRELVVLRAEIPDDQPGGAGAAGAEEGQLKEERRAG